MPRRRRRIVPCPSLPRPVAAGAALRGLPLLALPLLALPLVPVGAQAPFTFGTGAVDGRMALASRPDAPGLPEIEAADDFVLAAPTRLTSASFVGLLPGAYDPGRVSGVTIEIYRVFPLDSDVGRTSGPPTFSTVRVPTRVNSPADVALDVRTAGSGLAFATSLVAPSFSAANSIRNGINPLPGIRTGGEGPVTGAQVRVDVAFTAPLTLAAGHYFFVPQVETPDGDFYWLSSVRPIVPPGTPFVPDLQAWIRNAALDPDWLRAGTDVVGGAPAPTFDAAFTLEGTVVPEPTTLALVGLGLAAVAAARGRRRA